MDNIEQVDISPLMSYLIGVPIPLNSIVIEPLFKPYLLYRLLFIRILTLKGQNTTRLLECKRSRKEFRFQTKCSSDHSTVKSIELIKQLYFNYIC